MRINFTLAKFGVIFNMLVTAWAGITERPALAVMGACFVYVNQETVKREQELNDAK